MVTYSHSRLSSFETCPRQYWFAYIGKPDIEAPDTVEAFLGSRAHETLQELYQRLLNGQLMSREELLAWYENQWDRQWSDTIRIVRDEYAPENYRRVGRDALAAYYDRYLPFKQSRTLCLERRAQFSLDSGGRYQMQGYIDRIAQRGDGTYEIHDYKTSRQVPTQEEADEDQQLALYQIGLQGMWNDTGRVELVWHYLHYDKEIRSCRTPEQLEAVKAKCIALIDDIESRGKEEASFPTCRSALCDWCDFREICPATRHQVMVEALPAEQFKADDGVKLVDQWVETRERRRILEQEAATFKAREEEIQQQVLAFADQQGLESVAGSSHRADIVQKADIAYPKSGDDNRAAFEAAIHTAGLWDTLSTLDWQKLKATWLDKKALPPAARKSLQSFLSEVQKREPRLRQSGARDD